MKENPSSLETSAAADVGSKDAAFHASHLTRRLAMLAEYRLPDGVEHIKRIQAIAQILATELGLDATMVHAISETSQLHDVGMVAVPDTILHKTEPLTPEERDIIETHTTIGARFIGRPTTRLLRTARAVALSHHECWDGSGYPNGKAGEDIPIEARIVAVADTFDALQSLRDRKSVV